MLTTHFALSNELDYLQNFLVQNGTNQWNYLPEDGINQQFKRLAVGADYCLIAKDGADFDNPDEVTTFDKGKFETLTIGRATCMPGWKWSSDVGQPLGKNFCDVEHVGMVISGCATAAFLDGPVVEMHEGDLFYVPKEPHDS